MGNIIAHYRTHRGDPRAGFPQAFRAFRLGWIVTYGDRRRPKVMVGTGRKWNTTSACKPLRLAWDWPSDAKGRLSP